MPGVAPLFQTDPESIGGYRLLGRVGAGGQGIVYQAHSPEYGTVALKALHAGLLLDPGARSRLSKEVAAAGRVAPFCTARVLHASLDGEQPYVVSEFISGMSLNEAVHTGGPLVGTALDRLAVGTMTALVAIHRGDLVHRDFKPSNVVLGPDGPRVVDFGIARDLSGPATRTNSIIGTPAFMAPEQVNGTPIGAAADVFSWAGTMVFAATGRAPFEGDQTTAVMFRVAHEEADLSGVQEPLVGVLRVCLAKDPGARPSAQQVLMALLGQPGGAQESADPNALMAKAVHLVSEPVGPTMSASAGFVPTMLPGPAVPTMLAGQPLPPAVPGGGTWAGSPPATRAADGSADRSASRGPSRWSLVVAGIGVVFLLVGTVLTVLSRNSDDQVSGPPIVVTHGQTVPDEFVGSWVGYISNGSGQDPMRFDLRKGSTVAQLTFTTKGCEIVLVISKLDTSNTDEHVLSFIGVNTVDPNHSCTDTTSVVLTRDLTATSTPTTSSSESGGTAALGTGPSLAVSIEDLNNDSAQKAKGTVIRNG